MQKYLRSFRYNLLVSQILRRYMHLIFFAVALAGGFFCFVVIGEQVKYILEEENIYVIHILVGLAILLAFMLIFTWYFWSGNWMKIQNYFLEKYLGKQIKKDTFSGKQGCLKLTLEFLAEEEEINNHLMARLKALSKQKSKHIEITKLSLKINSFACNGVRYIPGDATLLIDYKIYKSNEKLPPQTWKVERFLYEKNRLFPEGSPKLYQEGAKNIWLNWMQMISRVKHPQVCVFSNYCSIEGYPEIFLAIGVYSCPEEPSKIPKNCYRCRYFYGKKYGKDFLVCGFHRQGKENCPDFKLNFNWKIKNH